jgi:TctA family transporter
MTLAILFWVLYLISFIFGLWREYTPGQPYPFNRGAGSFLIFILIGLLGWAAFGAPVK